MAQSILHVKPEDVDTAEKREKYTVSIIDCGQTGVLHACLFADAGFKVICVDADQAIVNLLAKGKTSFLRHEIEPKLKTHVKTGHLSATSDIKNAVSQSDVIAIMVPVKIDEKKKVNYSGIENACKCVGSSLRRGSLVILMSPVGFGFIEGVVKEILENTSGFKVGDFGLAYSPIPLANTQSLESLTNYERIIAAPEKSSLNSASIILEKITKKTVKKLANVKSAELATLFEITQRDVNVALANEFALFCEKAGIDYLEIYEFLNNGTHDVFFLPTLAESIRKEAHLLLEDAENLNMKFRIPTIAREINEEMIKHAVNLTKDALRECEKTLRRAKIALLGITQTPNMKSSPKTAAKELAAALEAKGAKISLHDPYFSENELTDMPYPFKKNLLEAVEGADCVIMLTEHDQFKHLDIKKLKVIMKKPAAIVDLEGIMESDKIEKEGFIYRGLGRGVWKK
jgi:UDP-N-acetyl-D-mannosaminuronic acid dehydrogenase